MATRSTQRAQMRAWHTTLRSLKAEAAIDSKNTLDDSILWLPAEPLPVDKRLQLSQALVILSMLGAVDHRGWEVQAIALWGMRVAERVQQISHQSPLVGLTATVPRAASLLSPHSMYSSEFYAQFVDHFVGLEAAIAGQGDMAMVRDLRVPVHVRCSRADSAMLNSILQLIDGGTPVDLSTCGTLQERTQWQARYKLRSIEFLAETQVDTQELSILKDICAKSIQITNLPKLSDNCASHGCVCRDYLDVLTAYSPLPETQTVVTDNVPSELVSALLSKLRLSQRVAAIHVDRNGSSESLWRWLTLLFGTGACHTIKTVTFAQRISRRDVQVLKETIAASNPLASLLLSGEHACTKPFGQIVATRFRLISPASSEPTTLWKSVADTVVDVLRVDEDYWHVCLPGYGLARVHRSDGRELQTTQLAIPSTAVTEVAFMVGENDANLDFLELAGQSVRRIKVSGPHDGLTIKKDDREFDINSTWLAKMLAASPLLERLSLPRSVFVPTNCLSLLTSHATGWQPKSSLSHLTVSVKQGRSTDLTDFFELLSDNSRLGSCNCTSTSVLERIPTCRLSTRCSECWNGMASSLTLLWRSRKKISVAGLDSTRNKTSTSTLGYKLSTRRWLNDRSWHF